MAAASEIASLEEINYKSPSKLKALAVILIAIFLMVVGFLNFYPMGEEVRKQIRTQLQGSNCNPDYGDLSIQALLARVVITDLVLPASCFNRVGEAIKLNHLTLNYHLISFFPLGLPFRIDTEFAGQAISVHYVLGFGEHVVRIKDQKLSLTKLMPLIAPTFKVTGNVVVDLNMKSNNQGVMTAMTLKAESKDLVIPSQEIESFNFPNLKLNDFFLESHSDTPPRIVIDRLVAGNPESPVRANFKGRIDLQQGGAAFSPIDLTGEVAFAKSLTETLPLDLVMGQFPQKDGFYQVKLGGTLGAPKGLAP